MRLSGRYVRHLPGLDVSPTHPTPSVLCHREPPRRARLCAPRHLPASPTPRPYNEAPPTAAARISATSDVRAGVPGDGRERRTALGVLQDSWLALHVRAHPARGPQARDERAVRTRAAPELQRRRARRRGHVARALWPRLVVGAGGLVGHARGAAVCVVLVRDGGIRTLEHFVPRADGGRVSEEAVWSRVGCVGGESTVQGDPRRVLMGIYGRRRRWCRLGEAHVCHIISYHVILCHVTEGGLLFRHN